MTEIQRILDQIDRTFSGNAWHGPPLMHLLEGISAEDASKHIVAGTHSVWELVHHIGAWNSIVQHRLQGETIEVTAERDWPPVWEISEPSWKRALEALAESHIRLRELAAGLRDDQLDETVPAAKVSRYEILHGVIQHDLYHAGQIAVLKKALGSKAEWPYRRSPEVPIAFRSDFAADVSRLAVLAGWISFGLILALGKRGAARGAVRRDQKSVLGFLLQSAAYALCFVFPRNFRSAVFPMLAGRKLGAQILSLVIVAIVAVSVWFCHAAARTLGRQWALLARVIEGHELVSTGPYAIVRNPIYLSMFGMFVASALAVARWQAGLAGLVLFCLGTEIRIRAEEDLLRAKFGARFEDYSRRVPAILPHFFR